MNREEEKRLGKLEIEVRNNSGQLETIITNHLPHLRARIWYILGVLAVLVPLVIAILVKVW